MSKKIIDWDELRAELLSDSEVQASFDAEERKERLREMLAQWRNHAGVARPLLLVYAAGGETHPDRSGSE